MPGDGRREARVILFVREGAGDGSAGHGRLFAILAQYGKSEFTAEFTGNHVHIKIGESQGFQVRLGGKVR